MSGMKDKPTIPVKGIGRIHREALLPPLRRDRLHCTVCHIRVIVFMTRSFQKKNQQPKLCLLLFFQIT